MASFFLSLGGAQKQARPCSQQLGNLKYCAKGGYGCKTNGFGTVLLEAM